MRWRRGLAIALLGAAALLLLAWLARAQIAARLAQAYFRDHGIAATVEIGALGLSGAAGRFALGPADAPVVSAERIELHFDPLRWIPRVVEVRLVHPVVRAQLDANGKISLASLQDWIDSLQRQEGKSRFVSDDLAVALTGLRLLLATPGGALELDGDIKLVKNLPTRLALRAKPAVIVWQGAAITLRDASAMFDNTGGKLAARFSGDYRKGAVDARGIVASLDAGNLRWQMTGDRTTVTAPAIHLRLAAASLAAGQTLTAPKLDVTANSVALSLANGNLEGSANLTASGSAGLDPGRLPSLRAQDAALANAIAANLARVNFTAGARVARRDNSFTLAMTTPLDIKGAKGAALQVTDLTLDGAPASLHGKVRAGLAGGGLPSATLVSRAFTWVDGALDADASLDAKFSFAMLHGAHIAAAGQVSWRDGAYTFVPSACARASLAAFHPGASDLAKNVSGAICATANAPLVTGHGASWTFAGEARNAAADLPLANAGLEKASVQLDFAGEGGDFHGAANVLAATVSDRATPARFKPLMGSGSIALQHGVWRGRLGLTDTQKNALGQTTFTHTMSSGAGSAHIAAPRLSFAPDKLQPEDLSALLAPLRRAQGTASFAGDITWTRAAIQSKGTLSIDSLDFLTPLGKAHAVKTNIAFTSLLPPVTADNQEVTISRIDWTLPFSGVDLRFAFSPAAVKVEALSSGWAEGKAALGAFTINLADPGHVEGAAQLSSIALGSLITASNLGSRAKMEGKISGRVPFTFGPEGLRIVNGHVESDGPGRLSINRSLWTQGAPAANAVQDFAYQALENLAYDQLTADLNSIANGRLQIVFHIKGHSAPPAPQTADVAIVDILNGTALQKQIPLPSGTPIDLTLDTSLNFDELLKSYAEAWSKSLSPGADQAGATP